MKLVIFISNPSLIQVLLVEETEIKLANAPIPEIAENQSTCLR